MHLTQGKTVELKLNLSMTNEPFLKHFHRETMHLGPGLRMLINFFTKKHEEARGEGIRFFTLLRDTSRGHCCWLHHYQSAVPLADHLAKLLTYSQLMKLLTRSVGVARSGDQNINISANRGSCYMQCLGCERVVMLHSNHLIVKLEDHVNFRVRQTVFTTSIR